MSEIVGYIVAGILLTVVAAIPVYLLLKSIIYFFDTTICTISGRDVFCHFEPFPKKLPEEQQSVLTRYCAYYKSLHPKKQKLFESRTAKFLNRKEFECREELQMTEEVKILIAAAAVQLTFGLRSYLLSRFEKIIIYPKSFHSPYTKTENTGEVNLKGIIVLSWHDFLKGYRIPDDGKNLGLHEMAHALSFQHIFHKDISAYFEELYEKWQQKGLSELNEMQSGKSSIFRDYGKANIHELFAVSIEKFFEQPGEFKMQEPELYGILQKMLNQDPYTEM